MTAVPDATSRDARTSSTEVAGPRHAERSRPASAPRAGGPRRTDRRPGREGSRTRPLVRSFDEVSMEHVGEVGGKNASLGEMIGALSGAGVAVPGGFATTAHAYRAYLEANGLEEPLRRLLDAEAAERMSLETTGAEIRARMLEAPLPRAVAEAVAEAYAGLCSAEGLPALPVAVRSSATAEDLPDASFAGQHESFLNVRGEAQVLDAVRRCYASLFTDRAISYRKERGFDHLEVALSAGIQRMVYADSGAAGVLFTLDPETGFPGVVLINAAWGLGESVVKGTVDPDQAMVFKPFLDRDDVEPWMEVHLGSKEEKVVYAPEGGTRSVPTEPVERARPVLSREETLQLARWGAAIEAHYGVPMDVEWARDGRSGALWIVQARPETVQARKGAGAVTYTLRERGRVLVSGAAVGSAVAVAPACVIADPADLGRFRPGSILVAARTDPDWGPVLARAAGVVTDRGGRTSPAAIVSRELGIPAVVGTGRGTEVVEDGAVVTERDEILRRSAGFDPPAAYFVDRLARDVGRIAASVWPEPAVVRTSDFKTNEYASLLGGSAFEPEEENPMLGFRGASRYYHERYRDAFLLECEALRRVRNEMGFTNVVPMIPFCRTLVEADRVLEVMAEAGLRRGEDGLEVYVMCEIPSNVVLAEGFARCFDGFSIGSNDLTQLLLGVDRDSELLAELFDERDEAVTTMIETVIERAHGAHRPVGFCGQAPSDDPDFAAFLVRAGIDSVSVSPDRVVAVVKRLAAGASTPGPR